MAWRGPVNIFGDPELRSIFHAAHLERHDWPFTPYDLLQVDWIAEARDRLERLAMGASEVAGRINDQERNVAEKLSPEFLALATAPTRSVLVRRFYDFDDAGLTRLFRGHLELMATNAPEGLTQRLSELSTAALAAVPWHPRLTAMGLRLPYKDTAIRTVEIEAENLAEDRDLNAKLARNYWKGIYWIVFTQEPWIAPTVTGRAVFIPTKEFTETSVASTMYCKARSRTGGRFGSI